MKNLLTALLCRLLVAAFCSSGGSLLSPSWAADAAPRESDGAGAGGGADKGKDANKTTRPNEPGRDGGHLCTAGPSEAAWCMMLLAAV